MILVVHEEHAFFDLFFKFLLARSMRTQADLVDQLFNSSEKRLARILLLMAEPGKPGEPEAQIPKITEETLAEMIFASLVSGGPAWAVAKLQKVKGGRTAETEFPLRWAHEDVQLALAAAGEERALLPILNQLDATWAEA
jgi:hypothetical protein